MQAQFTFLKLRRTIAKDPVYGGNKPIQEFLSNRASTPYSHLSRHDNNDNFSGLQKLLVVVEGGLD